MDGYLCQLPIKALPGIGHVLEEKLRKKNVQTCGQLRMLSKVFIYFLFFIFCGLIFFPSCVQMINCGMQDDLNIDWL